jgi:predicted short-subunit dehydrogenase-like oxidoreductase (DUF2520 family)
MSHARRSCKEAQAIPRTLGRSPLSVKNKSETRRLGFPSQKFNFFLIVAARTSRFFFYHHVSHPARLLLQR